MKLFESESQCDVDINSKNSITEAEEFEIFGLLYRVNCASLDFGSGYLIQAFIRGRTNTALSENDSTNIYVVRNEKGKTALEKIIEIRNTD